MRATSSEQSLAIGANGAVVNAFEIAARFSGVFDDRDSASLRVGSPLRIVSGALSITDIAFRNGFADGAAFSHAFKAHFGVAPRELRQSHHR